MADYSNGTVHELTNGEREFTAILDSAATKNQLVLLDFSASWCGPCRMLAPVLADLARQHIGRLVCVKMDCESTQANAALASSAGISAFPTLHLYRQRQRTAVLRGANPPALKEAIEKELSLLGSGEMMKQVAAELAKLRAASTQEDFVTAAKTLVTFISNILNNPSDGKYRRVKMTNASFQSKLGDKPGGKESMLALSFKEREEDGEGVLVMDLPIEPELAMVKQKLEEAIQLSGGGGVGASTSGGAIARQPAAAGVGDAAGSNVDPTALAQALAQAMRVVTATGQQATNPAGATAGGGSGGRRVRPPRQVYVTPQKLARYLEKILIEAGLAQPRPSL